MRWLVLLLLSGCAYIEPHWEVALGYQDDKNTDYWLQTDRSWQCHDNLTFDGELGIKTKTKYPVRIYYDHRSWVTCGMFDNDEAEVYDNGWRISVSN